MSARLHPLAERVSAWVARLPARRRGVVVAVSGGPDSMALLDVLKLLPGVKIVAAHFDHRLRRGASGADRRLVERVCARIGVELVSGSATDVERAAMLGSGMENRARQARYGFLEAVRKSKRMHWIATAHHLEDQVETFFLHLFRGAGLAGLGGMEPIEPGRRLFRPILGAPKQEILDYVARGRLACRHDATNLDLARSRNRVRWQLLPAIRGNFGEPAVPAIARAMELLRGAEAALEQWMDRESPGVIEPLPGRGRAVGLVLGPLLALPLALRRLAARRALSRVAGRGHEGTLAQVEAVLELARRSVPGKRLELGGVEVLRERTRLLVRPARRQQ